METHISPTAGITAFEECTLPAPSRPSPAPASGGDEGDGGLAVQAQLAYPVAVATDPAANVYVVSFVPASGNHRIRKIDADGMISAFAGSGGEGYGGDGDPAPEAQLAYPLGVVAGAAGNVYIADTRNARVRVVRPGVASPRRAGCQRGGHRARGK